MPADTRYPIPGRPQQQSGVVCFSWDDGYKECSTVLRPLIRTRNHRHTFFVTSGLLGNANNMTTTQVAQLAAEDHEIACHSKTHTNMTTLTAAQRVTEWDDSKTALEAIVGSGKVTSWAYPYGNSGRNAATDCEAYLRYDRVFNAGNAPLEASVRAQDTDIFLIPRSPWNSTTHPQVLEAIRMAAKRPIVVSVFAHYAGTDMTQAEMIEAFDLCDHLGLPCVTLDEAFPSFTTLMNPGFESGLLGWNPLGTGTVEVITDTPDAGMPGTKSLHIQSVGDTNSPYASQTIPVVPGGKYTLSGRVRVSLTSGAGYVAGRIIHMDRNGSTITSGTTAQLTNTSWGQFSQTFTLDANTKAVKVELAVVNKTAEAWFDHIHWGFTPDGVLG